MTFFFMKRIVVFPMHAEGKYLGMVLENACRAIALVHIKVNDQNLFAQFAIQQVVGCHCKIIEQAKSFALIPEGMMCATCHIYGHSVFKRMQTAINSALG